ncbi:MAG TPA: hypothetical protein PK514_00420 [Spirochaetota bacterium]|nr:hypothetical protein [Spirochaetota bacterium]
MHQKNEIKATLKIKNLLDDIRSGYPTRDSYVELGIELVKLNMIDQALQSFKRANQLKEDYLSLYNSASLYYRKNDYKTAILQLEKARKLKPEFVMISILAGICYSRMNNIRAAEVNFVNVLMTNPANRTALTALSILYHNQGRINESLNLVNRVTTLYQSGQNLIKLKTGLIRSSINGSKKEDGNQKAGSLEAYDKYIKSVPVEIFTDKYGTITEKIEMLETKPEKNIQNLISLSLCHLFSGNTDSALEYLMAARTSRAS